jgi:hypothetical protein
MGSPNVQANAIEGKGRGAIVTHRAATLLQE